MLIYKNRLISEDKEKLLRYHEVLMMNVINKKYIQRGLILHRYIDYLLKGCLYLKTELGVISDYETKYKHIICNYITFQNKSEPKEFIEYIKIIRNHLFIVQHNVVFLSSYNIIMVKYHNIQHTYQTDIK